MKSFLRSVGPLAILAGITITSPALGQGTVSNEALLKRIEELEQQVKILGRKDEIDKEASAEKAKTAAVVSAGAGGFSLRSADTNFVLKVRGYIQADNRTFIGDGNPVNDAFLLRRVRPIFEGTVWDKYDYRLMLDFGSGQSVSALNNGFVQDAYVNARLWPQFQIQAGKFKEPVDLERLQSGANLLFAERAYPTQLAPNRDVGIQLHGDLFDSRVNYAVGLFNGVNDGGSGDFEATDDEKDVAGRLFFTPFKTSDIGELQGLGFGIAGTYGNQAGTLRNFVSPGQQRFFSYRSGTGTSPNVLADGAHWRIAPQAYYYHGPFGILGEYIISNQEVVQSGGGEGAGSKESLSHDGWFVAASWFLTGEENLYKAVTPLKPFALRGEGWGALEAAARVAQLSLDERTFPIYADPSTSASEALSYTLGVNWHLNRNVKFTLNYEHTDFRGGQSSITTAKDENVILTRAQISF